MGSRPTHREHGSGGRDPRIRNTVLGSRTHRGRTRSWGHDPLFGKPSRGSRPTLWEALAGVTTHWDGKPESETHTQTNDARCGRRRWRRLSTSGQRESGGERGGGGNAAADAEGRDAAPSLLRTVLGPHLKGHDLPGLFPFRLSAEGSSQDERHPHLAYLPGMLAYAEVSFSFFFKI